MMAKRIPQELILKFWQLRGLAIHLTHRSLDRMSSLARGEDYERDRNITMVALLATADDFIFGGKSAHTCYLESHRPIFRNRYRATCDFHAVMAAVSMRLAIGSSEGSQRLILDVSRPANMPPTVRSTTIPSGKQVTLLGPYRFSIDYPLHSGR